MNTHKDTHTHIHQHTYHLHCSRQAAGIPYTKRIYSFKVLKAQLVRRCANQNTMKKGFQLPLGCLGVCHECGSSTTMMWKHERYQERDIKEQDPTSQT